MPSSVQLVEIRSKYSEQLLLKRMETYPELIEITQDVGKGIGQNPKAIRAFHEKTFERLDNWLSQTGGTLYFSMESIKIFYKLMDTLNLAHLQPSLPLDSLKLSAIRKKDQFRKSLRGDLYMLQKNEDYLELEFDK